MSATPPKIRVILDEGVPQAVAEVLKKRGHQVVPFEEVLKRGAIDTVVCRAAEANNAILVAFDRDMKSIARRLGVEGERFKRLSLIHFQCPEPIASKRLKEAMSFIEHEWSISETKVSRRLHISIGTHVFRTHR